MRADVFLFLMTSLIATLDVLQTEGRVYCYRRLRRRNKCGGFLRRDSYANAETCCNGRGQGFATRKVKIGKNRFRCSPCESLLPPPSSGPHSPTHKRPLWGVRGRPRHRSHTTTATTTTTPPPTPSTTTTIGNYVPSSSNLSTVPGHTKAATTRIPWPTPVRPKPNTVVDYPPPKDDQGNVIVWEEWSPCSVTCGAGWRSRARVCDGCDHNDYENVQSHPCMVNFYCPVDGNWGPWYPWHACSTTCGVGTRRRERKCNYPPPAYGGKYCEHDTVASKQCTNNKPCPVDGGWSEWSEYSPCSQTCGQGLTRRTRSCNNPYPEHRGRDCQGKEQMSRKCEIIKCPVDGGWSLWSSWTLCSSTCGQGLKERTRDCDSPRPNYGGKACDGGNTDKAECYGGRPCPVDGGWTEWTNYGYCRAPRCGRGYQIRSRSCAKPRPAHGGKPCSGLRYERVACMNNKGCSRLGSWCSWGPWNECSTTCKESGPVQGRQRECVCPSPLNGGKECLGQSFELRECFDVSPCTTVRTTTTTTTTITSTTTEPVPPRATISSRTRVAAATDGQVNTKSKDVARNQNGTTTLLPTTTTESTSTSTTTTNQPSTTTEDKGSTSPMNNHHEERATTL